MTCFTFDLSPGTAERVLPHKIEGVRGIYDRYALI
jgi:hypothetical protein